MESLSTTNTWLAILAIVSLLEFLIIVAAGFMAYRMYRQVSQVVGTVERVHIAPLRARIDAILDEVQMMTAKVKHAQESVGDAFKHVSGAGSVIAETVKAKTWPIRGIIQGVRVAAAVLRKNGHEKDYPPTTRYGT
jgi:hypothetical protein